MVAGQPRLRMIAFQVFEGVFVMVATATSGTGVPKVYRVTQGLKAESFYLVEFIGAQGQNRTADTGIFNTLGEGGSRQKVQIRISDMSREGFVVEWWFLDAPNRRMDVGPDEQPWQPSIPMVYSRRGGGTDP